MIVQLTPDQVAEQWSLLSKGFEEALPPNLVGSSDLFMSQLLNSSINAQMQIWIVLEDNKISSAAMTTITTDPGTLAKNLLVYAVYSKDMTNRDFWRDLNHVLKQFARSQGCTTISAYTDSLDVVGIATKLGWKVNMRYIYANL